MPTDGLLFAGTTTAPARDFVAEQLADRSRIVLPCVGRWAVATAVAARHGAKRIEASDLCLFSSIIGYMADPRHALDDLGVVVPERYQPLVTGAADEAEWAAGVLLAIKLATLPSKHVHGGEIRQELWARRLDYRTQVAEGLRAQVDLLAGARYDIADVRDVAEQFRAESEGDAAAFVNLPGYKGGYTKLYGKAEAELWPASTQLAVAEFDPDESPLLLGELTDNPALITAYIHHGDWAMPLGWTKLAAFGGKHGRTDYVIANRDTGRRLTTGVFDKPPVEWPVFTDADVITETTEVGFVFVDKFTCLHYRDLFVHRLGQTEAEVYGLMLLDGKVVTAFGLHAQKLRIGLSPFLFESFGISVSSNRYARLGKLFMLLLTSCDFASWLLAQSHGYQSHPPIGIRTASPTQNHEGKTDRSVMKLVAREPCPGGGYQLTYEALFRDETWNDVIARWLRRWGHKHRPGWDETEVSA
jgi:hypothetical protein